MSNCDWGKPCDCPECRTIVHKVKCPKCEFENTVFYLANAEGNTDRKGIFYYTIINREERDKVLNCYKCNHLITNVPYYEDVDTKYNERKLHERFCTQCNKGELSSYQKFINIDGQLFCRDCAFDNQKKVLVDPSTADEKYELNKTTLQYELVKVRKSCVSCGKKRWLKATNQWKTKCTPCFKKSL